MRLYYFFLKKILNVFQKIWQDNRADTRYIFFVLLSKDFKNGNLHKKSLKTCKVFLFFFFFFTKEKEGRKKNKKLATDNS